MKDLEWLKKAIKYEVDSAEEKYKERLYSSNEPMKGFRRGKWEAYDKSLRIIDQVEQPALPEIPEHVAEWIKESKLEGNNLRNVMINISSKENSWLFEGDNFNLFARAWLDGYTVEEKKYYIKIGPTRYARKYLEDRIDNQLAMFEKDAGVFTEKEILKLENGDKLWAFAVPVKEMEE